MTSVNTNLHAKLESNSKGATMVEMAVVLPLIVFLALGIAEFTFWLTADNLATTAAQRAASFLAAAPDIDNACDQCQFPENALACNLEIVGCRDRRTAQIAKGRTIAERLLFNTPFFSLSAADRSNERSFVDIAAADNVNIAESANINYRSGIDVLFPTPAAGESLKTTFQKVPIQVTVCGDRLSFLEATISPLFGRQAMPRICGQARAWKEPSFINSNAPLLDCEGKPITNPAAASKTGCGCLNDNDPTKQATTPGGNKCSCTCNRVREDTGSASGNVPPGVSCVCPAGTTEDANGCCLAACADGTVSDGHGQCTPCTCDGGIAHSSNGQCTCDLCPTGTAPSGGSCVCNAAQLNCGAGQVAGGAAGACSCQTCPPNNIPNSSQTACVCDVAALHCTGNTTPNEGACKCDPCPDGFTPNASRTACICDVAAVIGSCGGSQYVDTNSCSCTGCPAGQVHTTSGTSCKCPTGSATSCGPNSIYSSTTCGCQPCPTGQVATSATSCGCPASALAACGANQTTNSSCGCVSCPNPNQVHNSSGACVCPVAALQNSCGGAEYFDAAQCKCKTCPTGQTQSPGSPTSCSCPTSTPCLPGQTRNSSCQCACSSGKTLVSCVDRGGNQACIDAADHCANGNCYCDGFPPE